MSSSRIASISLPFGLIGLRHLTRFDLDPIEESWPFLRLRATEGATVELIVVEPLSILESYPLEISDEDAESLGLSEGNDALVLNVVAIHSLDPQFVTVNLAGPIVVNRQTWIGKQVIVLNPERYSVNHVLVDLRNPGAIPANEA
ncbi:MAG: hypothetical protein RLZZ399_2649 [Verrucomicrobiota bacterium]|jgi:flagellar assembly factor FliW